MKPLIILLLLFWPVVGWSAIRRASDAEILGIQSTIKKAEGKNEDLREAQANLDRAKNDSQKAKYAAQIDSLKKEQEQLYNEAIQLTIKAYEILPPGRKLPTAEMLKRCPSNTDPQTHERDPNKHYYVTWTPMFDLHTTKDIVNEFGGSEAKDPLLIDWGVTSSDGISRIFPEAFHDPARLASTIIHELKHFDQFTTPAEQKLTPGQREVDAYDFEQTLFDTLGFAPADIADQRKHIRDGLEHWKPIRDKQRGKRVTEVDVKSPEPADLKAIREGAAALRQQVIRGEYLAIADKALEHFHKATLAICKGSASGGDLKPGAEEFAAACKLWPNSLGPPALHPDSRRKQLTGCEADVVMILETRCGDPNKASSDLEEAAQERRGRATLKALPRMAAYAKLVCDPKQVWGVVDDQRYSAMCSNFDKETIPQGWYDSIKDRCEKEALSPLLNCWDPRTAENSARRAVSILRQRIEKERALERKRDREQLIRAYQDIADFAKLRCTDPDSKYWLQWYCDPRKTVDAISDKYKERGEPPPASYADDTVTSPCGRELLSSLMYQNTGSLCGENGAVPDIWIKWLDKKASSIHEKYFPAPPQRTPSEPRTPVPPTGPRNGGGWHPRCEDHRGCVSNGSGGCWCQPQSP